MIVIQAFCRMTKQQNQFSDDELELRLEDLPRPMVNDPDDADISGVVPMKSCYYN